VSEPPDHDPAVGDKAMQRRPRELKWQADDEVDERRRQRARQAATNVAERK